ncbi:nitroreductase/quinone reductase family protein [Longispora sp. K20-0274]|uniref:nitroreductase/quinone reductase family protein n=1 Tax=Longispora sp. K20-0274 TaxID=3088255 RepID=UPI00399A45CF
MPSQRRVGVVGLGEMGGAIATRLTHQGVTVFGLDVDPAYRNPSPLFRRAATLAEVAEYCEFLLIAVATDEQVEQVVMGEGGWLECGPVDSSVIVHSTISPTTCKDLAEALSVDGITLIDAGMSRGSGKMVDGSLTLFTGGAPDTLDRLRPLLELYSDNIVHAGPVGAGMTLKLCNNLLLHANRLAMLEAARLAGHAGIDNQTFAAGIATSTGSSWVLQHWGSLDDGILHGGLGDHPFAVRAIRELDLAAGLVTDSKLVLDAAVTTVRRFPKILTRGWPRLADATDWLGLAATGRVVLTTRGAHSGRDHRVELQYLLDENRLIVFASNGGAHSHPDWYHNLTAHPHCTAEIGDTLHRVTVTDLPEPERTRLFERQADIDPVFHDYRAATQRIIPVLALTPTGPARIEYTR